MTGLGPLTRLNRQACHRCPVAIIGHVAWLCHRQCCSGLGWCSVWVGTSCPGTEEQSAAVAELWGEPPELVTGVRLRERLGALGDPVAGED